MRFGTIDRVGDHRSGRLVRLAISCLALAVLVIRAAPARADQVDSLTQQLANASDYKTRLSAAIALSKFTGDRVIKAFIGALGDDDKNVRGAAAIGLAKVIDTRTSKSLRDKAVEALTDVKDHDSSSFVQKQAEKALDTINQLGGGGGGNANAGIYVNVGDMSAKTDGAEKMRNLMRSTTLKVFAKVATDMTTSWAGGGVPSKKQLDAKGTAGYHVDGTLTDLTAKEKGGGTIVSCKVSMYIATFPEKSVFGFLNGGASVTAGTSQSDQDLAGEDCVQAVIENLIANKIIPTIKTKVP